MNRKHTFTVHAIVADFGLTLEYSEDLPDKVYGYLDPSPEPRFIVVKRNLPECEEAFTIAHELGHYFLHPSFRLRREYSNWLTTRQWKSSLMAEIAHRTRRSSRLYFNHEWDADRFALCCLFALRDVQNLTAYIQLHPEKTNLLLLVAIVSFYKNIPRIFKRMF